MTTQPHPAIVTRTRTSHYMVDFLRRMEKRMGRIPQEDLRSTLFKTASRIYAEAMIEKDKQTKGKTE